MELFVKDVLTGSLGERMLQGLKYSIIGFITVICVLLLIAGFTLILSKVMSKIESKGKTNKKATEEKSTAFVQDEKKPDGKPLKENESEGTLKLIDVDEPTAAVIMAIVSDETKIPLNRLEFKQIKLLDEESK